MVDPRYAARALSQFAFRAEESADLRVPSNQALAEATGAELRRIPKGLPDWQHKTLYLGPRSAAEAAKVVSLGARHRPVSTRWPRRYRRLSRPVIYFLDRDLAQAQVDLAFPDRPIGRQDQAAAIVLSEYLSGGMQGVIFQEMREASGLVYSASAAYEWGRRPRDETVLSAELQTQPSKAGEAIRRLTALLRGSEVDATRLAEVKSQMEQRFRAMRPRPRRIPTLVDAWDEYREKADPRPRLRAEVAAMTAERLQAFWRRAVTRPFILAVTAGREKIDLPALGKLAELKVVTTEQLFGYGPFRPPGDTTSSLGMSLPAGP